jgi:hypothetical protein
MNAIHPKLMSGEARRAEIASLLATALLRHRARQAAQNKHESLTERLDCQGAGRLHAAGVNR